MAETPRRLGRWRIEGELGSGGMGTVYLGRRGSERAALKVILPGFASDEQFRNRFRREVQISARVTGPHVAPVIDSDTDAAVPWLASQYVGGPTLAQQVGQFGPLEEARARALALALASALRSIHEAGIIHRDLKPANVILGPDGPVVVDFGVAAAADATALTSTGMIVGSAGWMAPEQLRGESVGSEADVFSWGATVAFAASGQAPFGLGRTDAVSYRVAHEAPVIDAVPDSLRPLVAAALDKDPQKRPGIDEIIEALRPQVADAPTLADAVAADWSDSPTMLASPPGVSVRRRHRMPVIIATVVLLGVFAVGAILLANQDEESAAQEPSSVSASTSTTASSTSTTLKATTSQPETSTTTTEAPVVATEPPPLPSTVPSPPPPPELTGAMDSASDADVGRFYDFATSHDQQVVRLDLSWGQHVATIYPEPYVVPAYLYLRGSCPAEEPFCTGEMEVLIDDLIPVPEATYDIVDGRWVLRGHFEVSSTGIGTGGVYTIRLRAIPFP